MGTPNELVGAYAADGYAREKGAGALVTTFGPGELSALCGVAGAFCEFVPIIHIVGYPTSQAQTSGKILHHTLGDLSYECVESIFSRYGSLTGSSHYVKISGELSCATAILKDAHKAAGEIDRVLNGLSCRLSTAALRLTETNRYALLFSAWIVSTSMSLGANLTHAF